MVVVAVCAFGLGLLASPTPDVEVRQLPAMIVEREPPRFSEVPEEPVPVGPADDLARLAGDYPDGTTFALAAGVYRQDRIIPRHGQTFRGQDGVVFNGSVVLDPEEFDVDDDGLWFVDGQEQEGFAVGQTTEGNEVDLHPEEVFVDGTRRLDHVGSIGDLEPGAWHFDYAEDRIYLADDPAGFDLIETSVGAFAFGGAAVRDVVISDIVVEKYASPHYLRGHSVAARERHRPSTGSIDVSLPATTTGAASWSVPARRSSPVGYTTTARSGSSAKGSPHSTTTRRG